MDYREMGIEKVNGYNFLNEAIDDLTSRWSQSLLNVRSTCYLKQSSSNNVYNVYEA